MIGETIKGTYKIYEVVSQDPLVQVYMGRSLQTNEIVAVEIISKRIFDEVLGITRSEWNQRFRHEMDGLARIVSPHITRIYDFGEWEDTIFVVSEYVPGKSLKQVVEEQAPLDVKQALDVGRQIAACLEAVQAEKLSHGDLRPANVMVSAGGLVKLLEFGISKSFVVEGLMPRALVAMPYYVAPEQGEGETPDVRSDIYALGVMLYEMLTGKPPFTSEDPARLILKHIHEPAPSVRALQPDVPSEVEAIVARCLAKRPDDRFQSPTELIGAIAAVLAPALPAPAPAEAAVAEKPVTAEAAAPPPAVLPPTPAPPPAEAPALPPAIPPTPPPPPAEVAMPPTPPPTLPAKAPPAPPPAPPSPGPIPAAAPAPTEKRRKPNPILLGAGGAAAVLLVVLLAPSLLGGIGEKKAEVGGTASPAVTLTAVPPAGALATAAAVEVTTPIPATQAVLPAAPTVTTTPTATPTPTVTATPTETPTPTPRRIYLPLGMQKYRRK